MQAASTALDLDLVEQAAHNDQAAFGALYERHLTALYDYARRLMRDGDEAADVVQVAFIKAFDAIRRTGAAPRTFRPWLFQIAHNEAFDRLRRSRFVEPESEEALARLPDVSDEATPAAIAERRETAELVWRAVRGLRPDEQELLLLSVREGLDAGEIAQVIGKKRETVHVALSRVRDAFEDALTTLALLTQGRRECAELAALTSGVELSPKLRRLVRRHVEECETCAEKRRKCIQEMAVLAVLAPVQPPTDVKAAMWQEISNSLNAPRPWWQRGLDRVRPSHGSRRWLRGGRTPWLMLIVVVAAAVIGLGLAARNGLGGLAAAAAVEAPTPQMAPAVDTPGEVPTPQIAPVADATSTSGGVTVAPVPTETAEAIEPAAPTELQTSEIPFALLASPRSGTVSTATPTATQGSTSAEAPEVLPTDESNMDGATPAAADTPAPAEPTDAPTASAAVVNDTATPSDTNQPPSPTDVPTAVPQTDVPSTPVPPTDVPPTSVPPTAVPPTSTPVLPTHTPVPPTHTPAPPTATATPPPTHTPTTAPTMTPKPIVGARVIATATPTPTPRIAGVTHP